MPTNNRFSLLALLLIGAILAILCGCQSLKRVTETRAIDCSRNPAAAATCGATIDPVEAFEKLSLEDFRRFFESVTPHGFDENLTNKRLKNIYERRTENSDRTIGQILRDMAEAKDEARSIYEAVGYKFTETTIPPTDFIEAYFKLTKLLIASSRNAGIDSKDILLPALVFERTHEYKLERIFVTPGVDAIPDAAAGWKSPHKLDDLGPEEFSRMIQERKFALEPVMFNHDIGHIIDFILRPQYMKAYRNYVLAATEASRSKRETQAVGYTEEFVQNIKWIDRIMNEWIFLPRRENQKKIEALIPGFNLKSEVSEAQLYAKYSSLEPQQVRRLAQKFYDSRYLLFANHGGGARDNSTDRFIEGYAKSPDYGFGYRIDFRSSDEFLGPDKGFFETRKLDVIDMAYFYDEAPGIFYRLRRLLDTRYEYYEVTSAIEAIQSKKAPFIVSDEDALAEILAQYLAKIEIRIRSALLSSVTPEGIVADMTLLFGKRPEAYFETPTYKYFSTYPKHSIQNYLFAQTMKSQAN